MTVPLCCIHCSQDKANSCWWGYLSLMRSSFERRTSFFPTWTHCCFMLIHFPHLSTPSHSPNLITPTPLFFLCLAHDSILTSHFLFHTYLRSWHDNMPTLRVVWGGFNLPTQRKQYRQLIKYQYIWKHINICIWQHRCEKNMCKVSCCCFGFKLKPKTQVCTFAHLLLCSFFFINFNLKWFKIG